MEARFITEKQLRDAAAEIGVVITIEQLNMNGDRHRVRLYPNVTESMRTPSGKRRKGEKGDAKYQRIGVFNGWRVNAVCWHGYRDFFRACFKHAPDAKFTTAMDTWNGSDDFEQRYRISGMKNVGSMMQPVSAAEACSCPESGLAI